MVEQRAFCTNTIIGVYQKRTRQQLTRTMQTSMTEKINAQFRIYENKRSHVVFKNAVRVAYAIYKTVYDEYNDGKER